MILAEGKLMMFCFGLPGALLGRRCVMLSGLLEQVNLDYFRRSRHYCFNCNLLFLFLNGQRRSMLQQKRIKARYVNDE